MKWSRRHEERAARMRANGLATPRKRRSVTPRKICGCGQCRQCQHRQYMRAWRKEQEIRRIYAAECFPVGRQTMRRAA